MAKIKRLFGLVLFLVPLSAVAADGDPSSTTPARESYVSGVLGLVTLPTSSGAGTEFTFAGRLGTGILADPLGILSIGAYIGGISKSTTVGTVNVSAFTIPLLAELIDREAFGTGFYFGGRVGVGLETASVSSGALSYSGSASAFLVGPAVGYEIPVSSTVSVDLDASWLKAGATNLTLTGLGTVPIASSSGLFLQAGLTICF